MNTYNSKILTLEKMAEIESRVVPDVEKRVTPEFIGYYKRYIGSNADKMIAEMVSDKGDHLSEQFARIGIKPMDEDAADQIAKFMLGFGFESRQVSKLTPLTVKQIEKLRRTNSN